MKNRRKPLDNKAKRPSVEDRRNIDIDSLAVFIALLLGAIICWMVA